MYRCGSRRLLLKATNSRLLFIESEMDSEFADSFIFTHFVICHEAALFYAGTIPLKLDIFSAKIAQCIDFGPRKHWTETLLKNTFTV